MGEDSHCKSPSVEEGFLVGRLGWDSFQEFIPETLGPRQGPPVVPATQRSLSATVAASDSALMGRPDVLPGPLAAIHWTRLPEEGTLTAISGTVSPLSHINMPSPLQSLSSHRVPSTAHTQNPPKQKSKTKTTTKEKLELVEGLEGWSGVLVTFPQHFEGISLTPMTEQHEGHSKTRIFFPVSSHIFEQRLNAGALVVLTMH